LTAKLLPRFKTAISRYTLIPSKGGCFELTVGGTLLYSKLKTRVFPDEAAMVEAVGRVLEPGGP
jgi:selT/selW/selH-like putative selenoprotein